MTCLSSSSKVSKRPAEVLNVSMDFSAWLLNSETLLNPVIVVTPTGEVVVTNTAVDGNSVEFTVAGGDDGTTYEVEVTVETSDGETLVGTGKLVVRS